MDGGEASGTTAAAAMRARLRVPGRRRRPGIGLVGAALLLVLGAGVGLAHDDAGVMRFFQEEAARRLPAPVAQAVAPARPVPAPAQPRRAEPPRRVAAATTPAATPAALSGRTACVRLCDGYYFPLSTGAAGRPGQQAACEAACPHAPVAPFALGPGGDIGAARGPDGVLYRALPQAFAHQRRRVAGCSCQGPDNVARGVDPLRDPTLRRGDVVVGLAGARAYAGRAGAFEDFRRSPALGPMARRQVDMLLAVSAREARREAMLRTMTVARVEPVRTAAAGAGFAPVERAAAGFGVVRAGTGASFLAVN